MIVGVNVLPFGTTWRFVGVPTFLLQSRCCQAFTYSPLSTWTSEPALTCKTIGNSKRTFDISNHFLIWNYKQQPIWMTFGFQWVWTPVAEIRKILLKIVVKIRFFTWWGLFTFSWQNECKSDLLINKPLAIVFFFFAFWIRDQWSCALQLDTKLSYHWIFSNHTIQSDFVVQD